MGQLAPSTRSDVPPVVVKSTSSRIVVDSEPQLTWVRTKAVTIAVVVMYAPLAVRTCHLSGTVDPPFTVFSALEFTGGSNPPLILNVTVTLSVPCEVFPRTSAAEQLTVVAPGANVEPEAGVQYTLMPEWGTRPANHYLPRRTTPSDVEDEG